MALFKHPLDTNDISDSDVDFEYELPDSAKGTAANAENGTSVTDGCENQTTNTNKYLYPISEQVQELRPEEVRWFYKDTSKKWTPFIGYDSLRIECKYREVRHNASKAASNTSVKDERICVRGSLFEASVLDKKCFPIYWNQQGKIEIL